MDPANNTNYYNILKVPSNATSAEINAAYRRLSRIHHPDKGGDQEIFKSISAAHKILSDQKSRSNYDVNRKDRNDDFVAEYGGVLPSSRILSKEFLAKIEHWKTVGDREPGVQFKGTPLVQQHRTDEFNNAKKEFSILLDSDVPEAMTSLEKAVPKSVVSWVFNKITILKRKLLNSPYWASDLPAAVESKPFKTSLKQEQKTVKDLLGAKATSFAFPNIRAIKQAVFDYYEAGSTSIFSSSNRRPSWSQVPLCPDTPAMKSALGYIPIHTVSGSSVHLQKDATSCSSCSESYSLLRWSANCMSCGSSQCNDCLKVKKILDFVDPVKICTCCETQVNKLHAQEWVLPLLNDASIRNQVTSNYIALIDELGFASKQQFITLRDCFLNDGRYDLAIQCHYSGNGDWYQLAATFARLYCFSEAKLCLSFTNRQQEWWVQAGDINASYNPNFALLCYQKANLSPEAFKGKAFRFFENLLGIYCLIAAKLDKKGLNNTYDAAIEYHKYEIAAACALLGNFKLSKWIEFVNEVPIEKAPAVIELMRQAIQFDFNDIQFDSDRDHLCWKYQGPPQFEKWLNYLGVQLNYDSGEHCIPYFRAAMKHENFIQHRDEYCDKGEFNFMLICHRLANNGLSWEDYAKKLSRKNEEAALAVYLYLGVDLAKQGDELYNQGLVSLALKCYMQAGNIEKIKEKAKIAPYETRILYIKALIKLNPEKTKVYILAICRTLLTKPENVQAVKELTLSLLKTAKEEDIPSYYQLLHQTGMSSKETLGMLETLSNMSLNTESKKWYSEILASFVSHFKEAFRKVIYDPSSKELMDLIELIHPFSVPALKALWIELKIDQYPRCSNKSAALAVRAVSHLVSNDKYFEAMDDLTEAMLGDHSEGFAECCAAILEKISASQPKGYKFRNSGMRELKSPIKSNISENLNLTPFSKMVTCFDESVSKLPSQEAAMAMIDFTLAAKHPACMVGCFLNAASALFKQLDKVKSNPREVFAYRKGIFELVMNAYFIGNAYLNPATQIHALRTSLAILNSAFSQSGTVSKLEQNMFEQLHVEFDKLFKLAPVVTNKAGEIFDWLFNDMVNSQFITSYFERMRSSIKNTNPIYQYYFLEGHWNGWIDQEKYEFELERKKTMQVLLEDQGQSFEDVEAITNWPAIDRDEEGWMLDQTTPLNLAGQKFSKVEGIRFNMETGEISFLLESSDDPKEALFDMEDVTDIMKKGIAGSQFTLDPPDPQYSYHPFHEMKYAPESIEGTNLLGTLFQTDWLMKMFSLQTEISAKAPFAFRSADEGLFKRIPERVKNRFKDISKDKPETAGRLHRFWIEAEELVFHKNDTAENEITYTFSKCTLSVKKHMMERDKHGNLVDKEKDDETDSAEAKFANLMTEEYDTLGKSFPEFARLRELVKLQAMSLLAQNLYRNIKEQSKTINAPRDKIESHLIKIRKNIDYPKTDRIEDYIDDCLEQNNVTRSQVSRQQLNKLRRDIQQQCEEADYQAVTQIANALEKSYHSDSLYGAVKIWLNDGDIDHLVNILKKDLEDYEREKLLRICRTFKKMGIATKTDRSKPDEKCTWVPAGFHKENQSRVYGGVNLQPKMTPGGAAERSWGVNSLPPRGGPVGPGSAGTGFRHVVRMDSNGMIYGTTTAVDRVTGNTYRTLDIASHVKDQWNKANPPDLSAYWRTSVGYTPTHHYSHHTWKDNTTSTHVHGTNGWSTCNSSVYGESMYRRNQKTHQCGPKKS